MDARIVYSPHTYGPDVTGWLGEYNNATYPENIVTKWDTNFGFIESLTSRAVVAGEWGGFYNPGSPDRKLMDRLAKYWIDNCMADNFYWCYNANGGDTGGLVKSDWKTPETEKLKVLAMVQPFPSKLEAVE